MSEPSSISETPKIPDKIFVVPYRDREPHKTIFSHYMTYLLEGQNYEIYYIEQNDKRHFNRGALKNIGFMVGKEKYPDHYRNITFIFHDIDLLPYKRGLFSYECKLNEPSHYYGFNFVLGGIVAMKGEDFYRINGYPNYWAWGWEDNGLQRRFDVRIKGKINRSEFIPIHHENVLNYYHGWDKITSPTNQKQYQQEYKDGKIFSGVHSLKNIKKRILQDPDYEKIKIVKVDFFLTEFPEQQYEYVKETVWELERRLQREKKEKYRKNKNFKEIGKIKGRMNHYGKLDMLFS